MSQPADPRFQRARREVDAPLPECRILVVDNERDTADMQAMLLEMLGQHVQRAYDGRSALAMARRFRPDIVLLDLDMPGMGGAEVARELRAAGGRARIIAYSGALTDYTAALRLAGFDGFLAKPAGMAALVAVLREKTTSESRLA